MTSKAKERRIVKLKGGLGNQMFQYAFAKYLIEEFGYDVALDASLYGKKGAGISDWKISVPFASDEEVSQILKFKHEAKPPSLSYKFSLFAENLLNSAYYMNNDCTFVDVEPESKALMFDGYWQAWQYVEKTADELRIEFVPRNEVSPLTEAAISQNATRNAVFVGVRRGDYLRNSTTRRLYGEFSPEYFRRGMDYISKKVDSPVFVIFSNDIEWAKNNIDFSGFEVEFRDPDVQTSDFEELLIMGSCKHAVIMNSTFHWWGAWLMSNEDKIIVAPEQWFGDGRSADLLPPRWVRMAR